MCKIVSYELPYSIYDESRAEIIDEVFRRINSSGQHLSRQEIRQAGATGEFAQLVRKIAAQLRGDVSHSDLLLLSQMKNISISKDIGSNGIDPDDVFWVEQNIINKEDLRQSMDEEQIADLLAAMVIYPIPPSNLSVLDGYYGFKITDSDTRNKKIEELIQSLSPEVLENQFLHVYDEIKHIFHNRPKSILSQMLGSRIYKGPRYFQVLFLALYDLLIKQEKKIVDYDKLYEALEGIGNKTIRVAGGGGWWPSKEKNDLVIAASSVLSQYFIERGDGDPMYYSYATELETLLKQSKTENSQYDFKQGIYDINTNTRNDKLISKIFKTLTAMANNGKNSVGYILVGVADKFDDAEKIKKKFGYDYKKVGSFYITGIDGEVNNYFGGSFDTYFGLIKDKLKEMPISEHYRRQIGSKMRMVNYNGRSVIIIKIVSDNGAAYFDKEHYTRIGANNDPTPVSPEAMPSFFAKFV